MILVCIFLLLFAAGATAGELEHRVYPELQKQSLGPDALLIPDNLLRHEIAVPPATPALVRELLARPLAAADAAAIFERSVPAALRELAALQPPPEAADFETLLERYVAARPKTGAEFLEATARFARGLRAPGVEFPPPQVRETPLGRVAIGGRGPDRHGPHAALIVDPGGDDVYERAPPPAGGVSVIVDLAGDDRYGGSDFARGAFSALVDFAGDDRYDMRSGLGAARSGVSLLLDLGGNDRYRVDARGQGYAEEGGLGLLWDLAGDDVYLAGGEPDAWGRESGLSFAQGVAAGERSTAAGGVGILRDDAGDDRYEAQMFAQGAGYYFGLGLLWDRGGADRYRAARYAQGSGVHQALGVLRDESGDDDYALSAGVGQGVGHDMAVGVLLDRAGDDRYAARYLAQGSASANGVGLLADLAGSGHWEMGAERSAWGSAAAARGLPSVGLLVHDDTRAAFVRPELGPPGTPPDLEASCPALPAARAAGSAPLLSLLRTLGPGFTAGKPDAQAYGELLQRLIEAPQAAMAQVPPLDFSAMWALGVALPCAAAAAPAEALPAMWAAFERVLTADAATPFAGMIGAALRKRPAPPATQRRVLAALDAHPSCAVRAQALLAWPSEERARSSLQASCWREQAAALKILREPGAAALPSFLR